MKDQNFSQEQEKLHSYWLVTILNVVGKKLKIPGERLNQNVNEIEQEKWKVYQIRTVAVFSC